MSRPDATRMMTFDVEALDADRGYKLISAVVTPRPIAWVSSRNAAGAINLAPFSSYTFISYQPPRVLISVGPGTQALKDTLVNIGARGEFAVSSVTPDLLQPMVDSSFSFDAEESEAEALGIALRVPTLIETPFVAEAVVALECRLDRIIDVGDDDAHRLVIGTVVCFHVHPSVWQGDRIDPEAFRPLGRIGGPLYVERGELLRAPVPKARPLRR